MDVNPRSKSKSSLCSMPFTDPNFGTVLMENGFLASPRQYSRSHQRRFHNRFPEVDPHEQLIDWYSCALVAEILLQGYLYISENHFAFYSNILGYKTQLLIPISDVISVTKEKTARIFPNAVGICTEQAKYVFGSLISREATFKLLEEVWKSTLIQVVSLPYLNSSIDLDKMIDCDSERTEKRDEESTESPVLSETEISNENKSSANNTQSTPVLFASITSHEEPIKLGPELTPIQRVFKANCKSESSDSVSDRNSETLSPNDATFIATKQKKYSKCIRTLKSWSSKISDSSYIRFWCSSTETTRFLMFATFLLLLLFIVCSIFLYKVDRAYRELVFLQHQLSERKWTFTQSLENAICPQSIKNTCLIV